MFKVGLGINISVLFLHFSFLGEWPIVLIHYSLLKFTIHFLNHPVKNFLNFRHPSGLEGNCD